MSLPKKEASSSEPPSPPSIDTPSGGVRIPEGKDGFFDYSQERTLHQVRKALIKIVYAS
jgi:hypothetical protein